MATIMTIDSFCQMATARPGVFQRLPDDPSRQGEVIREPVNASDADRSLEIISTEQGRGLVHFESEVIVAGGRGLQSRERYQRLIDGLCMTLRDHLKVSVEKGASRAAVESGFVDRIHQVGQTGTAVKPRVYLAIGISGAIQHMIGISHSEVIMAINHDPDAPILRESDYYMVGPVEEVVPALIEALKGVGS
jgi:electron transfer flavoprotein alpha subunit